MGDENGRRTKVKEVLARHTDLEQSQNKAQGALLSVLALTQVTELKILLDFGGSHKLYHFVLALLIGSIALQIIVGIIVIYIGHVRYQSQAKKGICRRFLNCFVCKCNCTPVCCKKDARKRAPSYISVPIGVGAPDVRTDTLELTASQYFTNDDDSEVAGCCEWSLLKKDSPKDNSNSVERHRLSLEQAKVKLSNAVTNVLKLTTNVERLESDAKKVPKNADAEKELTVAREGLQAARREKEQADTEIEFADSRHKQAILLADELDEKEEMATFKKIRWWQQLALYMLYFITLMNVFVTAIGISTHS